MCTDQPHVSQYLIDYLVLDMNPVLHIQAFLFAENLNMEDRCCSSPHIFQHSSSYTSECVTKFISSNKMSTCFTKFL